MRHCRFIRMLNKPFKSPFSFSNLLDGGIFRSNKSCALFSILNFLRAVSCISFGNFNDGLPFQIWIASLSANERIILPYYVTNVKSKHFVLLCSNESKGQEIGTPTNSLLDEYESPGVYCITVRYFIQIQSLLQMP